MRLRAALLALVLGATGLAGPARAQEDSRAAEEAEARALAARLREGELAARRAALERLLELGDAARPVLLELLASRDPELRFHALYLLHAPLGELERRLVEIVVGQGPNAPTYPAALATYREIVEEAQGEGTRLGLVGLVQRYADPGAYDARILSLALDLLRELVGRAAARGELGTADVEGLQRLLGLDLGAAAYDLVPLFAAVPWGVARPLLAEVLREGRPREQARAALVFAEVVPEERALAEALVPLLTLLKVPEPSTRLAALQALDLLPLGADGRPLTPVVSLVLDGDEEVAEAALRIVGERGLALAREACEQVVSDRAGRSPALRCAAARALGLLGDPAAEAALLPLADPRRESDRALIVTAGWALGAIGSPRARAVLEKLIATPILSREPALYSGLARLGAPGLEALRALARPGGPLPRDRDDLTTVRARAELAIGALAIAPGGEAIELLAEIAQQPPVPAVLPGTTEREAEEALEALGDRREPEAAAWLARLLVAPHMRDHASLLLRLVAQAGLPERADAGLRERVAARLVASLGEPRASAAQVAEVARALVGVDPQLAQQALRRQLQGPRARQGELARDLAWSLARAGDPSLVEVYAIPYSRGVLEKDVPQQRAFHLNAVGIDLLYARRYAEAIVEFRRMLWCNPADDVAAYNIACGYALLGEPQAALHYIRRSVELDSSRARHMETDADLTSLLGSPPFERLLRRMRLATEINFEMPRYYDPPR